MRTIKLPTSILAGLAALTLSTGVQAAETITYTYDALGRLIKVVNTGDVNNNKSRSYCYDKAGNRVYFDSDSNNTPASCVTQG